MKILMIDTSPTGGIAHYTYNLCEALARRGDKVRLLTHRDYELSDFPRTFSLLRSFCREEPYWKTLRFLLRECFTFRPDVVHFQTLISTRKDGLLFALLRCMGLSIVFTAHNVLPHETRPFEITSYKWMYRLAARIIVHAEQNRREFVRHFDRSAKKVEVIPHGSYRFFRTRSSLTRRDARRKFSLPPAAKVVLFFGAIRPYKGLHRLIRSVGEMVRAGEDVYLMIAGKVLVGTEEEYRRAIVEAGIEDRVRFRQEYIPFDEVADYFTAADAVALPYEHIYDSGVLHIAFALGIPVVASRVGSFLDYVRDGETGLLVDGDDDRALTEALGKLLADEALKKRIREACRAFDRDHFGWDRIAERTAALYRSVRDHGEGRLRKVSGSPVQRTVLFVENSAEMIGGGQQSLLGLLQRMNRERFTPLVAMPAEGPLAEKIRALKIPLFTVPLGSLRSFNLLKVVRTIRLLARILRERQVDLVHTNASRSTLYAGLAARWVGVPLVWHVRIAQRESIYDRFLFALASKVIVISRAVAKRFPWDKRGRKISVVYNGLDLEHFVPEEAGDLRSRFGLDGKVVVGLVGQVVPIKGGDFLIEALRQARKIEPHIHLLVVGAPTPYQKELERKVLCLGLSDAVTFAGYQEDIPRVMSSIDILALPSRTEAFGRVLIEAMGCAKPVVAFSVDAVPEIVEDGVTGLLVPCGDVDALAEAIARLAGDSALRARMGARGRERVHRDFGLPEHVRRVESLYEEVLAS